MTSTGIGAPPDMQYLSAERSYSRSDSWWSSAKYMVGTPANTFTRSRSMISNASSGVKRGSSVMVPPAAIDAFCTTVCPNEWNSGSAPNITSSPPTGTSRGTTTAQLISRFEWVSSAPLGLPVVPEV